MGKVDIVEAVKIQSQDGRHGGRMILDVVVFLLNILTDIMTLFFNTNHQPYPTIGLMQTSKIFFRMAAIWL